LTFSVKPTKTKEMTDCGGVRGGVIITILNERIQGGGGVEWRQTDVPSLFQLFSIVVKFLKRFHKIKCSTKFKLISFSFFFIIIYYYYYKLLYNQHMFFVVYVFFIFSIF